MATIPAIRAVVTEAMEQVTSRFREELRGDLAALLDARLDALREARLALIESCVAAERGASGKADAPPLAAAGSRPPTVRAREAAGTSRPPEPARDPQRGAAEGPWRDAKNGAACLSAAAPSALLAPPPCPGAPRHGVAGEPPPAAVPPAKPPPRAVAPPPATEQQPPPAAGPPARPPPASLRQALALAPPALRLAAGACGPAAEATAGASEDWELVGYLPPGKEAEFGENVGRVRGILANGSTFVECPELKALYGQDAYVHSSVVAQCALQTDDEIAFSVHVNSRGLPQVSAPCWRRARPAGGGRPEDGAAAPTAGAAQAPGEEEPPTKAAPRIPPARAPPSQGGLPVKPAPPLGSGSDPLPAKAPPLPVKSPPPLGDRREALAAPPLLSDRAEAPAAPPLIRKAPPAQFAR